MSTTLVLTAALLLSGRATDATALEQARALLAELPAELPRRVSYGAQLLTLQRMRPDVLRTLVAGGALALWPTVAALADAGATTTELTDLIGGAQ